MLTEENLETLILGHIAQEIKGEIEVSRQVSIAKKIMQSLRTHKLIGQPEKPVCKHQWQPHSGKQNRTCDICGHTE